MIFSKSSLLNCLRMTDFGAGSLRRSTATTHFEHRKSIKSLERTLSDSSGIRSTWLDTCWTIYKLSGFRALVCGVIDWWIHPNFEFCISVCYEFQLFYRLGEFIQILTIITWFLCSCLLRIPIILSTWATNARLREWLLLLCNHVLN